MAWVGCRCDRPQWEGGSPVGVGAFKHNYSPFMVESWVDVVYWTAVVIILVAVVGAMLFHAADRAVGNEKATKLVSLGFAVWIILAMSATAWLVAVVWEWRLNRGEGGCQGRWS